MMNLIKIDLISHSKSLLMISESEMNISDLQSSLEKLNLIQSAKIDHLLSDEIGQAMIIGQLNINGENHIFSGRIFSEIYLEENSSSDDSRLIEIFDNLSENEIILGDLYDEEDLYDDEDLKDLFNQDDLEIINEMMIPGEKFNNDDKEIILFSIHGESKKYLIQ